MTPCVSPLMDRAAWKTHQAHYIKVKELSLRELFVDNPRRVQSMTDEAVGIYFDYSKNLITNQTLSLLLQPAEESGLRAHIDATFRGTESTSRRSGQSCT